MDRLICHHTPEHLERSMAVRFPGFTAIETVLRAHRLETGAYLVRTDRNLHHCHADLLVEVVAVPVPGMGLVSV